MPRSTPRTRRLAAVWFADIVDYSRLAAEHERAALSLVDVFEGVVRENTQRYGGRVVKFVGDAAFAEFGSTEAAVQAALALQEGFMCRSASTTRTATLRIGVHVGDVVLRSDGDLHGDGVNLAARIQVEAEPGQTLVSEDVWRQLRQHPEYRFDPLGERELRGINTRLELFAVSRVEGLALPEASNSSAWSHAPPLPHTRLGWARGTLSGPHARMVRLALSGLALAAISLLVIVIHRPVQSESRREATYAVLPLLERTPGVSQLMSGEEAQLMLYDALARWRDIRLVSMLRLNDLELRSGGHPRTLGEALETARAADATLLVWGQLVRFGDSLQIRAGLYDVVGREEPAREYVVTSSANLLELRAKVDGLAQSLLLGHVGSPSPEDGTVGTRSLAAWKAYDRGHAALDNWDLGAAENEFYLATRLDPEYPQANLWLAQVMSWAGTRQDRPDLWRTAAARASARRVRLNVDDQIRADALHALAEERFPEACADYSRLLARDSAAFAGWYGIGECNRSDPIVVRDARSPSGWTFRGSYHTAVQAYQRALELFPSAHLAFRGNAFHRLQHLLSTEPNVYRAGVTASRDGPRFGAFPSLIDDTLAYVPYPLEAIIAGRPGTNPPTLAAAVARNRTVLKRIALSWTRAFPSSADAHEVLGYALESSGTIGGVHGGAPSALEELSRARGLATERLQQLRLASAEVRLLVKNSDFANAQALADSILRSHPGAVEADTVELLTGLAALTGQPHRLVELLRTFRNDYTARLPDGRPVEVPPRLAETALTLIGYAAMGAPVDSIRSAKMRIEQLLPAHVPATELQSVRAALLERPLGLAFPVLGPAAVEGFTPVTGSLMEAEQALVRKDGSSVRAWFAARQRVRRSRLPGSTSIDAVLQEAWLLLALSDTSTAVRHLDASLGALPTLSTDLLDDVAEAAAVARAMALRAELAHRQGDDATSHRWAAAVVTLWAGADEVLQPVVRRMQGILSEEGSTAGSTLLN